MNFVFLLSFFSYSLLSQVQINLLNFVQFLEDFSQKKKNYLRQWRTVWEFLYDIQGEIAVIQ